MHHTASPVYSIFIDILLLHTHTHTHNSTAMHALTRNHHTHTKACTHTQLYHRRDLSSLSVIFIYIIDAVTLPCTHSVFCQCNTRSDAHLYALEPGCNKALESLIDDSIYFYLCCVCTCNSILCVLPLIDMFNLCTNAKNKDLIARSDAWRSCVSCLSRLCSWSGLDCLYS